MAVVEPELALLEMEIEGLLRDAVELGEPTFRVAPEGFDPVDVTLPADEFVLSMVDPAVLLEAHVYQAVIGLPAIAVDRTSAPNMSADQRQQRGFAAIGDDLGVDLSSSLQDAKDDGLAPGAASTFPADAIGAEVGFVDLHLAGKRRLSIASFRQSASDAEEDRIHGTHADPRHRGSFSGGQIKRKALHEVPEPGLRNLRTLEVLVLHRNGGPFMVSPFLFAS